MRRGIRALGANAAVLFAAGAAAVAAAGCIHIYESAYGSDPSAFGTHNREWTKSIDATLIESTDSLDVSNRAGEIRVISTEGPARVEVSARSHSAERLDRVMLEMEADGDLLKLSADWPGGWQRGDRFAMSVYLPSRDGVRIESRASGIHAEGMRGPLRMKTSAGSVTVDRHDGPVRIETSAGGVRGSRISGGVEVRTSAGDIELDQVGWPIEAVTSAGDITVSLLPGFDGELRASTSAGDIGLPSSGNSSLERSGGKKTAWVRLGSAPIECVFRTSAGDVDVRVLTPENTARPALGAGSGGL